MLCQRAVRNSLRENRRTLNHERPLQDSAILFSTPGMDGGIGILLGKSQGFLKFSATPRVENQTDFSAGKCHLLYFVVVPESLRKVSEPFSDPGRSGMFRHNASLAIPHLKSFAAIPSISRVHLGHTNRSVSLSHESQREIALAVSEPQPNRAIQCH